MLWPRGMRYDHMCQRKMEYRARTRRCRVTWRLPTTNDDNDANCDDGETDCVDVDDDDVEDANFVPGHLLLPNLLQALASDRLTHIRAAAQLAAAGLYRLAAASTAAAAAAPAAEAVELAAAMLRHRQYGSCQFETLQQALQIADRAKLHAVAELALQDLAACNALKVLHNFWICS